MLLKLTDHISNCLDRAAAARHRAEETADPRAQTDFLRLEQSWNCLAQSYQWAERLERFLLGGDSLILADWQPISSAPFDGDLQLAVIANKEVHALAFPCRRILGGWIDAKTKRRLELAPTHWREWTEPS